MSTNRKSGQSAIGQQSTALPRTSDVQAQASSAIREPSRYGIPDARPKVLSLRPLPSPTPGVVDLLMSELLSSFVRVVAQDPSLAQRLSQALTGSVSLENGALLLTKNEYAERLRYSVRKLDQLIQAGMPTIGKGRALRIPVGEADRWVLNNRFDSDDEGSDLDLKARESARRRSGTRRQ